MDFDMYTNMASSSVVAKTKAQIMTCDHCYSTIFSEKHNNECNTINMYQVIECIIKPDSKNMMTYGLNGCTAIIMVFFKKDTNKPYKIIFGHHPIKNNILTWYKTYYDSKYNIVTCIKSPGYYEKRGEHFTMVIHDENYWKDAMNESNNTLILEPYSKIIKICCSSDDYLNFDYNSTLYLKIYPEIKYTNCYGKYINIIPKTLL